MRIPRFSAVALLAACAALAACGGSAPTAKDLAPHVSLLSTVPNPGGGLDRWAELHFTFSAPVDWAETQFVTCVSGCRASLVPYRFVSTGSEVVGTPILPPEFGASYTMRITPLFAQAAANGDLGANIDFAWSTLPAATTVSSDVTADTTLSLAGSPYYFMPGVLVRAALTIDPGVEVAGDLVAAGAGSVTAIGTPTAHVRISNAVFSAPGRLSYVDMLGAISVSAGDVDHADIEGARISGVDVLRLDVAGALTDSRVTGFIVRTLAGDTERNVFLGSTVQLGGGFIESSNSPNANPATRWTGSTIFRDNYVDWRPTGAYSGLGALLSAQASGGTIRGNTFAGLDAARARPAIDASPADLSGNYWGTADAAACAAYFDPQFGGTVPTVAPVLSAPDPSTPTP